MVAQEGGPLAIGGDGGQGFNAIDQGPVVFTPQRQEQAGHQREVESHVEFIAFTEVSHQIVWPLVGFRQQNSARVFPIDQAAHAPAKGMGFRQVFAVGAITLKQVGNGINPEAIDAQIQPETHHIEDRLLHRQMVVVEVGLVAKEAVPVVTLGLVIPGPIGVFRIAEDHPGFRVAIIAVTPYVVGEKGGIGPLPSLLKPVVLI